MIYVGFYGGEIWWLWEGEYGMMEEIVRGVRVI